jgi:hypothetical protein
MVAKEVLLRKFLNPVGYGEKAVFIAKCFQFLYEQFKEVKNCKIEETNNTGSNIAILKNRPVSMELFFYYM